MDRNTAEAFVYRSYLEAQPHLSYEGPDSGKRHPELTRSLLQSMATDKQILVTGSKGKGSTALMLSQLLQTACRVGLMTSPHIQSICERFRVDGKQISDRDFVEQMEQIAPNIQQLMDHLPRGWYVSPIGIQAALALHYFKQCQTDYNIIECGKGVRYDDVNNIPRRYAVINTIFLEHTRELGATLTDIAADKACIITRGEEAVYVASQTDEVMSVIRNRAADEGVALKCYGDDFEALNPVYTPSGMQFDVRVGTSYYRQLQVPLFGIHMARNAALALALAHDLLGEMDEVVVRRQLSAVVWPGRLEVLSRQPFVMLDACVNRESTEAVKETLKQLGMEKPALIVCIPQDKDYVGVVKAMASDVADVILTQAENRHYVFSPQQCEMLAREGVKVRWMSSLAESVAAVAGRPIVILGTTAIVPEARSLFIASRNY